MCGVLVVVLSIILHWYIREVLHEGETSEFQLIWEDIIKFVVVLLLLMFVVVLLILMGIFYQCLHFYCISYFY